MPGGREPDRPGWGWARPWNTGRGGWDRVGVGHGLCASLTAEPAKRPSWQVTWAPWGQWRCCRRPHWEHRQPYAPPTPRPHTHATPTALPHTLATPTHAYAPPTCPCSASTRSAHTPKPRPHTPKPLPMHCLHMLRPQPCPSHHMPHHAHMPAPLPCPTLPPVAPRGPHTGGWHPAGF